MLQELQIQDYKRIEGGKVTFLKLSRVNYFVGENGSGKSTVLEYIFEQGQDRAVFIRDSFSAVDFWREVGFESMFVAAGEGALWQNVFARLLNKRWVILDLLAFLINANKAASEKAEKPTAAARIGYLFDYKIILEAEKILTDLGVGLISGKKTTDNLDNEQLLGGVKKIFHIVCGILAAKKSLNCQILLLDEPEVHLHPSWQKILPDVFGFLSQYLDVQIFVATHSPFIISSVSELTETEKNQVVLDLEPEFSQKVYFLKNGQVADKHGSITSHGSKGYTGKGVSYITSKMLGVGLMDFIAEQQVITTKDAPKLVLCEGEGKGQDARIYNIIFRDLEPPVLFVSCRGNTQLHKTFRLLKEIKPGLSANFEIFMLRDRDHDFASLESIWAYEKENEQCKVLYRRAIEAYLYNSETAKLVLKQFKLKLAKEEKEVMDNLQEMIQISAEQGVPGDIYKSELEQMFGKITQGLAYRLKNSGNNLAEKVAWLITPKTKVYKELYKEIFR